MFGERSKLKQFQSKQPDFEAAYNHNIATVWSRSALSVLNVGFGSAGVRRWGECACCQSDGRGGEVKWQRFEWESL